MGTYQKDSDGSIKQLADGDAIDPAKPFYFWAEEPAAAEEFQALGSEWTDLGYTTEDGLK